MKVPAMIPVFLAMVLTASAAGGEALSFFMALREHDPAKRGEALLKLAERDAYPAELALIHLTRNPLPPKSTAQLLSVVRRHGGLVPTVLLLRAYRQDDDFTAAAPMDIQELFRLAREAWRAAAGRKLTAFETPLFRELTGRLLDLAGECGENVSLCPELEALVLKRGKAWHEAIPPAALLDYYYRLAFAAEGWELLDKDDAGAWKDSPHPGRRNFFRLLQELRNLPPADAADTEALVGFFLATGARSAAVRTAADFMQRHPKQAFALFLYTVVEAGEVDLLEKVKPLIKPEFFLLYRATALKSAGKFHEALALVPRIADPASRDKLELECRMAVGDFGRAAELVRKPGSPLAERARIFALLELAESTGDVKHYRAAEQLAGPRIDTDAAWANSFGYVALVLGLDRDQAERRIRFSLSCHPQNTSLLDSLAWARYRAGDWNGAWKYMDMALRRCRPQPENCEELEHAGAIREALGDRAGAKRYYSLALKLAREYEKRTFGQARAKLHVKRISEALEKLK